MAKEPGRARARTSTQITLRCLSSMSRPRPNRLGASFCVRSCVLRSNCGWGGAGGTLRALLRYRAGRELAPEFGGVDEDENDLERVTLERGAGEVRVSVKDG